MKSETTKDGPHPVRVSWLRSAAGVFCALPAMAVAQQAAVELKEVTVIGTRTEVSVLDNPRSVTVVDQQQIDRQAPLSIGELLRDVPGVELVDATVPGMKRLQIRGESSRRVTILIDGQEVTDHSSYGTPILINPAAVERIDVVRGPTSVLYGAKAIGGVVNIITKRGAPGKAAEVELGGTYYSGTDGWQGWASVSGTKGDYDYRITGGIADHGDQRTPKGQYTDTGRLDNTEFSNDDISAHFGYRFGEGRNHYFSLKAEQYRLETQTWKDPSVITGEPPGVEGVTDFVVDLPQRDRKKVGLYYDATDLSPTVAKVHVDAYYQTVDREFVNDVETYTPPGFIPFPPPGSTTPPTFTTVNSTSDDVITNYGGTGQVDLELAENHYTILGIQYLADVLDTDKTSNVDSDPRPSFPPGLFPIENASSQKARIDTFSIFGQDEWDINDDLRLFIGLRYNHIKTELEKSVSTQAAVEPGSSTDNRFSSSLGLVYNGVENTTLRALYSSGYINPTLLQSFGRTTAGGDTVYGNPDLDVETANNFELGYRYDGNGLVVDAVAFYTLADDYITTVDCGISGTFCPEFESRGTPNKTYTNADSATTYGLELLTEYFIPDTQASVYASGAWMRRKIDYGDFSTTNTNVPTLAGRVGARYGWVYKGVDAWADLFVRASTGVKETEPTDDGPETSEVDGWATLNLAFGGTYGKDEQYRLVVQLNNLTNEEYRPLTDTLPGVGRSVDVTAAVKF